MNSTLFDSKKKKILFDYDEIISNLQQHRCAHKAKVLKQPIDLGTPAWVRVNPGPSVNGNPKSYRLCLGFKNIGCMYRESDEKKLGCLNCGYYANTAFKEIKDSKILQQFEKAISIGRNTGTKFNSIEFLNDGSFFNTEELSKSLQIELFERVAQFPEIYRVLVESRPEHLTIEGVMTLSKSLRDDQLFEVGIGLESADDFVRETCINKGFSKQEYEQAIQILSDIKHQEGCNIAIVTYLLVKPAFLSEKESINDLINSICYLEKISQKYKIDIIPKLEPAAIVDGTILSLLHNNEETSFKYHPLSYWSILEILSRLALIESLKSMLKRIRIGAREDMDDIIKAPAIYSKEDSIYYPFDFVIYESIQKFNQHHDFNRLFCMISEVYRISNEKNITEDQSLKEWIIKNEIENCAIVEYFDQMECLKSKEEIIKNEIEFMMMIYSVLDVMEGYNKKRYHEKELIDNSVLENSKHSLEESISYCFDRLFPGKPVTIKVNIQNLGSNTAEVFFDVKDKTNDNIISIWSKFSLFEPKN